MLTGGCAFASAVLIAAILTMLVVESIPAVRSIGVRRLLFDVTWHPADGRYGLCPMVAGSLLVVAGAVALATPCGLLSGLFVNFYAPAWAAGAFRLCMELLASVPSVVFGLWGMTVVVPAMRRLHPPGASLAAGAVVLALMVLPMVVSLADAALRAVPREWYRAATALGLTRWSTLWRVVVPAARQGLVAGVVLQIGRALGETMAVLMVCGNIPEFPTGPFSSVRTLTANIALEMPYAGGVHRSALFLSGLVLLMVDSALFTMLSRVSREGGS